MRRNKNYLFLVVPILMVLSIFLFPLFPNSNSDDNDFNQELKYHSSVCTYVRIAGSEELVENGCDNNVLYNVGAEFIEDSLLGPKAGFGDSPVNISLCNATAGCGVPVAGATEAYSGFSNCGLANVTGTYTDLGNANWTIGNTFISTCDSLNVNATRLVTNSTGKLFAGNNFTLVTLQNNDQLIINWSIWVS